MRLPTWIALSAAAVAAAAKMSSACSPCPPGEHRYLPCSSDPRKVCIRCPANTFSSKYSLSDECEYCRNYCLRAYEIIVTNCTSRMDTVCHCKPGTWLRFEEDPVCLPHTGCPKGSGVKHLGTRSSDTVCEKCPPGHYSDVVSAIDPCRPLTDCKDNGVKVAGDRVSDNTCHPAASTVQSEALPDWAVAAIVVGAVMVVIALLAISFIFLRRRASHRQTTVTSGKGYMLAQQHEARRPAPPPAYGEATLNDLGSMPCHSTAKPLLELGGNIESDDVNRNIMEDFEKLDYKTSRLPRDLSGGGGGGGAGQLPQDSGGGSGDDEAMQEVFVELGRSIRQPHYVPFFQHLPECLSAEQLSAMEVSLADGVDQQSVVVSCLETWRRGLSATDRAMEYLVQTLRHETFDGNHEAAARALHVYEEAAGRLRRSVVSDAADAATAAS